MLNYSIEIFNPVSFVQVYTIIITVMVVVNTLSFLLITYVIIFYGKSMEVYRWLLLVDFIAGYILDIALYCWHVIQFLPVPIYYFDGIIGRYLAAKFSLSLLFCFLMIKGLTLSVILLYRYAMAMPGPLQEFMKNNRNVVLVTIGHILISFLPMIVMFVPEESPYDYIDSELPILKNITFGSNVTYMPRSWYYLSLVWLFIVVLTIIQFINTNNVIKMYRFHKKMKDQLSHSTYRMHHMLILSAAIEHGATWVTNTNPIVYILFALAMPFPYGSHVIYFSFISMSFQTAVSAILQCVFIKPFRKGAMDLVKLRFLNKSVIGPLFTSVANGVTRSSMI